VRRLLLAVRTSAPGFGGAALAVRPHVAVPVGCDFSVTAFRAKRAYKRMGRG
jgi:hypothetical protein